MGYEMFEHMFWRSVKPWNKSSLNRLQASFTAPSETDYHVNMFWLQVSIPVSADEENIYIFKRLHSQCSSTISNKFREIHVWTGSATVVAMPTVVQVFL